MSYEQVTIQDCIEMYVFFGKTALIENGQVKEFREEEECLINIII